MLTLVKSQFACDFTGRREIACKHVVHGNINTIGINFSVFLAVQRIVFPSSLL